MPVSVLDACAMVAYLRDEVGGDVVESLLLDTTVECLAHSVNLCEVWHICLRDYDEATAKQMLEDLRNAGVTERPDIDEEFWLDVGRYRHVTRAAGHQIALMDCFAIALANRCGGEVVTTDHHEFDYIQAQGICPVRFVR